VELVRVVALAWTAKRVARAFPTYVIGAIQSSTAAFSNIPTLPFSIVIALNGDSSAFGLVFATNCIVFQSVDAIPELEADFSSQMDEHNISDIGTSPARC
jgi:hypothetical protein